jgi:hypothetical protein
VSEDLHPAQIEALKEMTPARRLEVGMAFIEKMRALREAVLRQEHPDWTEEQIGRALREFVLHACGHESRSTFS